jgi:hypothetical protein
VTATGPASGAGAGAGAGPAEGTPTAEPGAAAGALNGSAPADPSASSRWVTASEQVRSAAKWFIAALAAASGVVFGSGPIISSGELSGDHVWARAIGLALCASVAAGGVLYLIFRTTLVLLPYETSLGGLPDTFLQRIEGAPDAYLPSGISSVAQLRIQLRDRTIAERRNRAEIETLRRRLDAAETDEAERAVAIAALQRRLGVATPAKADELRAELDALQRESVAAKEDIASWESELFERQRAHGIQVENVAVLESVKRDLLEQSAFSSTNGAFTEHWPALAVAAMLAVLGGVGYLLLWSTQDEDPPAAAAPSAAMLVKRPGDAGESLWAAAGLAGCEVGDDGHVPILVSSGTGTVDDPYQVSTMWTGPGCPTVSFSVIEPVARVIKLAPTKVTIEYDASEDDDDSRSTTGDSGEG